jgi:hypothetical protein
MSHENVEYYVPKTNITYLNGPIEKALMQKKDVTPLYSNLQLPTNFFLLLYVYKDGKENVLQQAHNEIASILYNDRHDFANNRHLFTDVQLLFFAVRPHSTLYKQLGNPSKESDLYLMIQDHNYNTIGNINVVANDCSDNKISYSYLTAASRFVSLSEYLESKLNIKHQKFI